MSWANRKKSDWLVDIGSTENRKYGKMSVAQVGQGGEAAFDRGDALGSFTRPDRPRRELAPCRVRPASETTIFDNYIYINEL